MLARDLLLNPIRQSVTGSNVHTDKTRMLPLSLLSTSQSHPVLIELKGGDTLNGHLVNCDTYMNITLKEVIQTNPQGDRFLRLPEVYVRGNNIKYLRVPEEVIEIVKMREAQRVDSRSTSRGAPRGGSRGMSQGGRGGRGFRGASTNIRGGPRGAPRGERGMMRGRGRA